MITLWCWPCVEATAYRPLRSIAGGGMNDFHAVAKAPDTI